LGKYDELLVGGVPEHALVDSFAKGAALVAAQPSHFRVGEEGEVNGKGRFSQVGSALQLLEVNNLREPNARTRASSSHQRILHSGVL
jgi:hypothetical protein